MHYLVSVDVGTQGTKTTIFDENMNPVSTAFEASVLINPAPGTVWQEADDIFMSCCRTVKEAIEKSGIDAGNIAALCLDGQMAGIMGIDDEGEAVTYYDSWLDTRCEKYMQEMQAEDEKKIISITGGPVTYTHGPKILWWKNEHPDVYKKISKFVLPHGYVAGKLAGLKGDEAYFDFTCIQYSGFGDNLNKKWSDELLAAFDVSASKMARVLSPFEIIGSVKAEYSGLSGLKAGTIICAGAGDTAASVFGAGMFTPGDILDCAGTASVLSCIVDEYKPDTEYKTMTMVRTPIDGLWMPLAYINGGGLCIRWFRDTLSGTPALSYDELEKEAETIPIGSEGILFVPHFSGRVLPQDPYVKGSYVGLDWKHTRAHMYRATFESIAYEYKYYLDIIKKLYPGTQLDCLSIVGGGSKCALFNQIKADVLGMNAKTFDLGDTALAGSAVIAGVAAGVFSDYKKPILDSKKTKEEFSADKEKTKLYAPYQQAYLEVIKALRGVYKLGIYE